VETVQHHLTTDYCTESNTQEMTTTLQYSCMTATYFLQTKLLHPQLSTLAMHLLIQV
jgi:hypothetical protein